MHIYVTQYQREQCPRPSSSPLAADPPGQLDVLWHDGDPLCMDGTKVSVLKQPHKVGLCCLLQSKHRMALESQISLAQKRESSQSSIHIHIEKLNCMKFAELSCLTLKSCAISLTSLWNGSFLIRSSVLFWYFRISLSSTTTHNTSTNLIQIFLCNKLELHVIIIR